MQNQYFERASKMMALQEKFIMAVMNGNVEAVTELCEVEPTPQDPNPLKPDVNGEIQDHPLILFAAKRKDWKMVSELYYQGANIDVCDVAHGWYLVNEVILNASDKMFEALAMEFNLDVATRDGNSPLMIALKNDKFERAEFLLKNTAAQYSTINNKKENVGHEAIRKERYDFFIDLVKAGMSYDLKNKEGKTPLDLIDNAIVRADMEQKIEALKESMDVRRAANYKKVEVSQEEEKEAVKVDEPKKKVSGLSSIKR